MGGAAGGGIADVYLGDSRTGALFAGLCNGLAAVRHRGATAEFVGHPGGRCSIKVNNLLFCLRTGLHGAAGYEVWALGGHVLRYSSLNLRCNTFRWNPFVDGAPPFHCFHNNLFG